MMNSIRIALLKLATDTPSVRKTVVPLTKQADKWKSMPKGWTDESRKQFWDTLTGDNKHKVTKCIKEMGKADTGIDNPGAFCAALADRVLGKDWRSEKKAIWQDNSRVVSTADLPRVVRQVLADVRFRKRKIAVNTATSFSMYSAGDDGAKGFTALVNIDTDQYNIIWGAFGGGALGLQPSPVDDVNTSRKPLPDHMVVVQGQIGGRDPYASITCTPMTLPRLTGASRMAAETLPQGKVASNLRNMIADLFRDALPFVKKQRPFLDSLYELFTEDLWWEYAHFEFEDAEFSQGAWGSYERDGEVVDDVEVAGSVLVTMIFEFKPRFFVERLAHFSEPYLVNKRDKSFRTALWTLLRDTKKLSLFMKVLEQAFKQATFNIPQFADLFTSEIYDAAEEGTEKGFEARYEIDPRSPLNKVQSVEVVDGSVSEDFRCVVRFEVGLEAEITDTPEFFDPPW